MQLVYFLRYPSIVVASETCACVQHAHERVAVCCSFTVCCSVSQCVAFVRHVHVRPRLFPFWRDNHTAANVRVCLCARARARKRGSEGWGKRGKERSGWRERERVREREKWRERDAIHWRGPAQSSVQQHLPRWTSSPPVTRAMTHSYVCHVSFTCVSWLIHTYDMTYPTAPPSMNLFSTC